MKIPKTVSLVKIDTHDASGMDLKGFEEFTCSRDFLKQMIGNPRTKSVSCPIAELCGWKKNFLLYFHDMSDVWMEQLSVGQNNQAATMLSLDPSTGFPKHKVQGVAYVMYDNGSYALPRGQIWSLCQVAKGAVDAFATGELRGKSSSLDTWCDQYRKQERESPISPQKQSKKKALFKHAAFANPTLLDSSKIFGESAPLDLFAITCMSPDLGGKWRRLFSSSKLDGYLPPSTESLEACMKQQVGPSIFVIKIADNHLIGGCSESGMKFGYFLFEIEPYTRIHRSLGAASKYFIKHHITTTNEHGEELKGTGFFAEPQNMSPTSSTPTSSNAAGIMKHKPQLFISEHFHWCKGVYLDVPFSSKVQAFEVWGIDPQTNSTGKPAPGVGGGTKPGPKCVAWTNPWKKRFPEYF